MSEYFYTKKEAEKAILVGVALQSENISYNMMCEYLDELAFLRQKQKLKLNWHNISTYFLV